VKRIAFFPLAKLAPLLLLIIVAVASAAFVLKSDALATAWATAGLLPLVAYLAIVHFRARALLLAEQGREREIVRADLVATAAQRTARFWTVLFSMVAGITCIAALAAWVFQVWLWYKNDYWVALTWNSLIGIIGHDQHIYVQRLLYWLGDTNIGALILIGGALIAAPLAAINHKSLLKAKRRKLDLASLKRRS
jgi:hypothetical protein